MFLVCSCWPRPSKERIKVQVCYMFADFKMVFICGLCVECWRRTPWESCRAAEGCAGLGEAGGALHPQSPRRNGGQVWKDEKCQKTPATHQLLVSGTFPSPRFMFIWSVCWRHLFIFFPSGIFLILKVYFTYQSKICIYLIKNNNVKFTF